MQKLLVIGSILCVLLSFQNCAPHSENLGGDGTAVGVTQYNKYSVSDYSVLSVWDFMRRQYLDVDIQSGVAQVIDGSGVQSGSKYCLSDAKLQELSSILDQAEICEPVPEPPIADRVCTQEYAEAYASLVQNSDEVRLGEKVDGCAKSIDLCGEKSKKLQAFTSDVIMHLMDGSVTKACL